MERVKAFMDLLGREIRGIIRNAFELSYFSRGAWQYESVLNMTAGERDIGAEFINKRLEHAAKMQHPVF
jgi:hypothetical protein